MAKGWTLLVWGSTLGVALAILIGGWLGHIGTATLIREDRIGDAWTVVAADGEGYTRSRTWTHTVTIDPRGTSALIPLVPIEVVTGGDRARGPEIEIRAWVGGTLAYQATIDTTQAPARLGTHVPSPLAPDDAPAAQEGPHEVRVEAHLERPDGADGSTRVTLGPIRLQQHALDRTYDGIPDEAQLLPSLNMGLVTLPLAVAGAAGTKRGLDRWLAGRDRPEEEPPA